jgi:hypothetical protein
VNVGRRLGSLVMRVYGRLFPWLWTFAAPDKPALAELFTQLRDAGVHFRSEGSHSWGPAEIFEQLRQDRVVSGAYKKQDEF